MRFFTLMPAGVIGATFIFTSCAIIKGGIETIASRMLDARRTLVVGLALMTGLAVEAFPVFFHAAPATIEPLVDSPLVLGTFVGFALNAVFRIGTRRRAVLTIDPHAIDFDAIQSFMEGRGGLWGARRDVITRATYAAQQLIEVIADNCAPLGPIACPAASTNSILRWRRDTRASCWNCRNGGHAGRGHATARTVSGCWPVSCCGTTRIARRQRDAATPASCTFSSTTE